MQAASAPNGEGVVSTGSGILVSKDGVVANNAHVVKGGTTYEVSMSNELGSFDYNAKLLKTDYENDVALLQIDDQNFRGFRALPYKLNHKADVGEAVFTIGFPMSEVMGDNFKVTNGIVSSETGIKDDVRYYQISVPLQPGNSGGALFNSEGDVVGLTTSRLNEEAVGTSIENVNYAIKVAYVTNLLYMSGFPSMKTTASQTLSKRN